ncbi:MAG: hypothetical protein K2H85_11570, partial [Allobaculum sp.]|nr:hypothetical protein [Allobaculum sp.]
EKIAAICDFTTMIEVVPDELVAEFHPDNVHWDESLALRMSDLPFIFSLVVRYLRHPYFVLKVVLKIALYQSVICRYDPRTFIVGNEYSFTSSILTAYCRNKGICHIDVMHGEKLYYLRDSFFCFDRCYVWAPYYVNLFIRLKASPDQFRVAVPPSLHIDTAAYKNSKVYADVKYYLGDNAEEDFASIIESLRPFRDAGMSVKYRLHPRYSNRVIVCKYCSNEDIEDPNEVPIQESISNMTYAVGSYSTVLMQALLAGKTVILDDVTYRKTYDQLKEMGYILSNKPHHRLSNLSGIC